MHLNLWNGFGRIDFVKLLLLFAAVFFRRRLVVVFVELHEKGQEADVDKQRKDGSALVA